MSEEITEVDEETNHVLFLLCAIVDRGRRRRVRRTLEAHGVLFSLNLMGMGTARTDLLTYLGIGDRERDIVLAAVPAAGRGRLLRALSTDLKLKKHGSGILFTLPMSAVGGKATLEILRGDTPSGAREREGTMHSEHADLIITIVQRGYAQDVVEAAKSVGAQGATVLHGRASGIGEIRRFYGITVEPQKDVVLMLVPHDIVGDVMRVVCQQAGLKTAGMGISFSLPVVDVVGALGFDDPPYVEEGARS